MYLNQLLWIFHGEQYTVFTIVNKSWFLAITDIAGAGTRRTVT